MKTLIVVPARYESKRFPGKPLVKINDISMLRRTANIAEKMAKRVDNCDYVIATDDERIEHHCEIHRINYIMTPSRLKSGSDRALAACEILENQNKSEYTHIINLQGDAPFTPGDYLQAIYGALAQGAEIATPFIQMSWEELDVMRLVKADTPFSGTTLIKDSKNRAVWFSKAIIPAIKNEVSFRETSTSSPILRHIGLYGYKKEALVKFTQVVEGIYEKLEGLEQLRFLENGMNITAVKVLSTNYSMSGIDTQKDLVFAEGLIKKFGDPFK